MAGILKIIEKSERDKDGEKEISVGIDLKVGDREIPCPVSKACRTHEEFVAEIDVIKKDLDRIVEKAGNLFKGQPLKGVPEIGPDMSPEEIWRVLTGMEDEALFKEGFNALEESRRKETAEFVLSQCNIFSGKGAVFSSHYNEEKGLLD